MKRVLLALCLLTAFAAAQTAQPATPTQQTATHADACTPINAQAASGSQTILTIPAPPSGQYVYLAEVDIQMSVSTVLGSAVATTSVTVAQGATTYLKYPITLPVTANTNYFFGPWQFGNTVKFPVASTSVVITGVAGAANLTQNINACYYYGY